MLEIITSILFVAIVFWIIIILLLKNNKKWGNLKMLIVVCTGIVLSFIYIVIATIFDL